jgi:hypothetical protein
MKTWSDALITTATRLSDHLGPLTKLIDSAMDRVVSVPTAQACSYPDLCGTQCIFAYCSPYGGDTLWIRTYGEGCGPYQQKCTIDYCGGC